MTNFWDIYSDELPEEKAKREAWSMTLARNASGLCYRCNMFTDDLMFGECPDCGREIR